MPFTTDGGRNNALNKEQIFTALSISWASIKIQPAVGLEYILTDVIFQCLKKACLLCSYSYHLASYDVSFFQY